MNLSRLICAQAVRIAPALIVLLLLVSAVAPASALSLKTEAKIDFPNAIIFNLKAETPYVIDKAVLRFQVERATLFEEIIDRHPEFEPGRKIKTSLRWDLTKIGGLPPGTKIKYFWIIEDIKGNRFSSPPQSVEFVDPRFPWKKISQDGLTLFWYEGDEKFARELLSSAQKARLRLERLLGVELGGAKFYIYKNTHDLHRARVFPREWEGGVAFGNYGTAILVVSPENLSWGKRAITHELSHLAIFQAIFGGFSPIPTWLDEGLAVYMEGGLSLEARSVFDNAIKEDKLISIRSLSSPFPVGRRKALLSYAQSYSLMDFLIKTDEGRMVNLLKALKDGEDYREALLKIYGWDVPALERAWRQSLGLPAEPETIPDPPRC